MTNQGTVSTNERFNNQPDYKSENNSNVRKHLCTFGFRVRVRKPIVGYQLFEEADRLLGNTCQVRIVLKVDKMEPVGGGVGRSPLEVIHQSPRHISFHFDAIIKDGFQHLVGVSVKKAKF